MPEISQGDLGKLRDLIAALQKTVNDAIKEPDAAQQKKLMTQIKGSFQSINKLLADLDNGAGTSKPAATDTQTSADGPAQVDTEPEKEQPIQAFFEQIGQGVIQAQQRLDQQSLAYMQGQDARLGAPTAFRMPKASAELMFDFGKIEESGFNIILASRKTATREGMQHKVAFDIVATPPPPELMASLAETSAAFPFVGRAVERQYVRQLLQAYAKDHKSEAPATQAKAFAGAKRFPRILIFRTAGQWILLDPQQVQDQRVIELGILAEAVGGGLQFTVSTLKRGEFGGNFALFYELLRTVSAEQAQAETGKAGTGA